MNIHPHMQKHFAIREVGKSFAEITPLSITAHKYLQKELNLKGHIKIYLTSYGKAYDLINLKFSAI